MPPKTAAEKIAHRTNNCIGLFAVAVLFFILTLLLGRSTPNPATATLLWLFALMGGAALGGWIVLSYRQLSQPLR